MIKRANLLELAKDRVAVLLLVIIFITTLLVVVTTIVRLNPSDVQIPIRFSAYGTANIYRNQWFTLYIFPVFAIIVSLLNTYLSVKIYSLNRFLTIGFLGVTVLITTVCLIVTNAVLNLAPSA